MSGRTKIVAPPLRDPYGRPAEIARWLMLGLLAGHLLLRRAFAHRNFAELLPSPPAFLKYAYITEVTLAALLICAAIVLLRRWSYRKDVLPFGEDALHSGLGAPVWISLAFVTYGAIHALIAFGSAGTQPFLIFRQSALAAYTIFFGLTVLFFGARGGFVRNAVKIAVLIGVVCALLDTVGLLKPGWGDRTGQYPNEMPFGQMTLPLSILGLGYYIVVSKAWSWRMAAIAALALVAWRQSVRIPQTVVPLSFMIAIWALSVLSVGVGLRGQKNTLRRAMILLGGCILALGIAVVLRPQALAQRQEARAWDLERYTALLYTYDSTQMPTDPKQYVSSKRQPGRLVNDPEVYKLNAVYAQAGSTNVVNNIWRILIWRRMLNDWQTKYPLFGAGVGKPWFYPALYDTIFHYGDPNEGLDPHNSYLNILNRYGAIGLLLVLSLLGAVAWTVWRALRMQYSVGDPLLEGLILFSVYTATFAFFTVSLEGPSYALPFWMSLGLTYSRARQVIALKGKSDES